LSGGDEKEEGVGESIFVAEGEGRRNESRQKGGAEVAA